MTLMDEPTGNLDDENTQNVMSLLERLNKETKQTFILTTHNVSLTKYANKIYFLRNGTLTRKPKDV